MKSALNLVILCLAAAFLPSSARAAEEDQARDSSLGTGSTGPRHYDATWRKDSGDWSDPAGWIGGIPDANSSVSIPKNNRVNVSKGEFATGSLDVGTMAGDNAKITIQGGELIVRRVAMQLSQWPGSMGEVDIEGGAFECATGMHMGFGKTEPGLESKAVLRLRGGTLVTRSIVLAGFGPLISIEGSKSEAFDVLDFIRTNSVAGYTDAPSWCTFSFTLDEHGVTPITIRSTEQRNSVVLHRDDEDHKGDNKSMLAIKLSAVPPRDDVTLVHALKPTMGAFYQLPEGSKVSADYQGQTYHWTLTYQGGKTGCDIVLRHAAGFAENAPATHCRPLPEPPELLWKSMPLHASLPEPPKLPAFPGAEGFGAGAVGGRGGKVLFVDNLNNDGPGSLRAAVAASGPRTVLFRVGGIIHLKSDIVIREPWLTLAGQSAPGDGIEIRDGGIRVLNTHDIILRYLRVRPGEGVNKDYYGASIYLYGVKNSIVDHCSCSWATGEGFAVGGLSDMVTLQWCFVTETLLNTKQLAFGAISGGDRVTWHHNLFADLRRRIPGFADGSATEPDFRNNVLYNWWHNTASGDFETLNYVSNYLRPGPSTEQKPLYFYFDAMSRPAHTVYLAGNIIEGDEQANRDNWSAVTFPRSAQAEKPFPTIPANTEPAVRAFEHVLQEGGATLPVRDAVDTRIVDEVRNHKGRLATVVADVPGLGSFKEVPLQTTLPGMPDLAAANQVSNQSGYTKLEEWLDSRK